MPPTQSDIKLKYDDDNCPFCNYSLLRFSSLQIKTCEHCNIDFKWELKENQYPIIKYQR